MIAGTDKPIVRAIVLASITALLFLLIWYAAHVLLTIFAGILLAVFLRGLADLLSERTGLAKGWSLLIVILAIAALAGTSIWMSAPRVAAQIDQLLRILPGTFHYWTRELDRYEWGRWVLAQLSDVTRSVLEKINFPRTFSTVLDLLAALAVMLFVGIYLAVRPERYRDGIIRLMPVRAQAQARQVADTLGHTLRWWLIGRSIAMSVVFAMDLCGLLLLHIPLALTLALISGLLTFIPYLGATIAMVPAVLVAFSVSAQAALYVFLLKLGVQVVEGYVVTPLVQRRVVHLPPALTVANQFLLGELTGILGLTFATPLAAIGLVLVKMLYLHEDPEE